MVLCLEPSAELYEIWSQQAIAPDDYDDMNVVDPFHLRYRFGEIVLEVCRPDMHVIHQGGGSHGGVDVVVAERWNEG